MESIINLEGWQLLWTCAAVGIIGGGLLVALGVLAGIAERIRDEWRGRE